MFNRALACGIALILVLTGLLIFALARITDHDIHDYKALASRVNPKTDTPPLLTQERTSVTKEIRSGSHTLKVTSASSTLTLSKLGTTEEMVGLKGSCDSLYTFYAAKGLYDYRTHRFTAHEGGADGDELSIAAGRMELYLDKWPTDVPRRLLHHIDPEGDMIFLDEGATLTKPSGTLTARSIWIAQKGGELDCAQTLGKTHLTASNGEELTCAGLLLDTKTQRLIASGPVDYTDERGSFSADQMVLHYENDDEPFPTEIHLTGNVQIKTHSNIPLQYALADEALYMPQTDTLTLTSHGDQRVLFLDESSDTRMSARKIIAHTKDKTAEGVGGVRCFFKDEELTRLKEMLR